MQDDNLVKSIKRLLSGKESHPRYQKWFDEYLSLEQRHLKNFIPLLKEFTTLKDKTILDFGCGTGGSSVALGLNGAKVVGVEPGANSVDVALARIKKFHLEDSARVSHLPDTTNLPFLKETFDVCLCHSVLEYIPGDRQKYIQEMWRVIKPDGILFIAGSSNGLYPMEMHSGKWFVNYGSSSVVPRGVTYWEIIRAIKPGKFIVLNQTLAKDGLARYCERLKEKDFSLVRKIEASIMPFFLRIIKVTLCPILNAPIEAFLPWLDLGLSKSEK